MFLECQTLCNRKVETEEDNICPKEVHVSFSVGLLELGLSQCNPGRTVVDFHRSYNEIQFTIGFRRFQNRIRPFPSIRLGIRALGRF